ncbi:unnamed protein product, partial [Iphiclides podalirius]
MLEKMHPKEDEVSRRDRAHSRRHVPLVDGFMKLDVVTQPSPWNGTALYTLRWKLGRYLQYSHDGSANCERKILAVRGLDRRAFALS